METEDKSSLGNGRLINSRGKIGKRLTIKWIINTHPRSRIKTFHPLDPSPFFFHHRMERVTVPILTFLPRHWNEERKYFIEKILETTFPLPSLFPLIWNSRIASEFSFRVQRFPSLSLSLSLSLSSFFFYNQGIKHEHSASPCPSFIDSNAITSANKLAEMIV